VYFVVLCSKIIAAANAFREVFAQFAKFSVKRSRPELISL
jgi:hypothetical protein